MFGGTPLQPQQPQPQFNPPAATEAATSAEEEALKKNTDCVYFLASPLTCKKGSECEYRHSDIARVNPRDCWYWLNGNCLNPKCAFRHPPLDGLLGIQTPTSVGLPTSQATATPVGHGSSGKQGVPCVFFQKGFCLKGDRCPFLHAPFSANKVGLNVAASPVNEPPTLKKSFGGLEKNTQAQKVPQINVLKPVEPPPQGKPAVRVETAFSRNGVSIDKYVPPSSGLNDELPRYRPANVPPATQGDSINRSNRVLQAHVLDDNTTPNGKDVDEFSREPSPGFDVLVDDDLRDSDYYPNEDQFGRTRGPEGRNLNPLNDYDIGRSAEYNSMVDVDHDLYHDYDSFERLQGQYGWEEHRLSSERMLGGPAHMERRRYPRVDSPDRIEQSDLRNLLAKQRRGGNGLRSVISRDHARDNRGEDRNYRPPRRDTHHLPPQESSVSSRLRGRIKIPGRSTSPVNDNYSHPEREMDRGRNRGRLSPERPLITTQQGRLRDRIKGRGQDDFNNEGRNLLGLRIRRDAIINDNNNTEFHGPKRLSELKVGKNNAESSDQHMSERQSLGKRKFPHQQSEGDLSFEGPKPLSEILKRKRGSEAVVSDQKERKENLLRSAVTSETRGVLSSVSKSDTGGAEQESVPDKVIPVEGQSLLQRNVSNLRGDEEGLINDEAIEEDHEVEAYDQREGDYEEEQVDEEEDYNIDGGENAADLEEEYLDDDDEADDADDFAKKMGVMYS